MASFIPTITPTELIRNRDKAPADTLFRSKEQFRKEKEIEDARKAGTVPAEQDLETGRDINPHIPQYISQAPWYAGAKGPTLKHQRHHPEKIKKFDTIGVIDEIFSQRGVKRDAPHVTKFRKGACENCGSLTHQKKDCFERPRRVGAKFTGEEIAPDEYIVPDLKMNFDAKRDRWVGYNPEEHKAVIEEHEQLEEARKEIRDQRKADGENDDGENEENDESEARHLDEDKYAEDADMPGVEVDTDSRTRITVRNLRIREDTAKYLYNLDPESAYYDPKSRSMHENPFAGKAGKAPSDMARFGGENFVKYSGEVSDVNQAQLFAWEANRRGTDVHTLAEPTKLEMLRKEFTSRKTDNVSTAKKEILEKYGGEEYIKNAPPKELLIAQSERYVEYNRMGKLIKGEEKGRTVSKYPEDEYPSNHTAVWGSYYDRATRRWGFACCRSLLKQSYCTGTLGVEAQVEAEAKMKEQLAEGKEKEAEKKDGSHEHSSITSSSCSTTKPGGSTAENESEPPQSTVEKMRKKSENSPSDTDDKIKDNKDVNSGPPDEPSSGSSSSGEESTSTPDPDEAVRVTIRQNRKDRKRRKRMKQKETKRQRKEDEKAAKTAKRAAEEAEMREAEKARKDRAIVESIMKGDLDERALPFNVKYDFKGPTDDELERYQKNKTRVDDPMAKYVRGKDV